MEAKAVARHVRIAPRKVRAVVDQIRGKDVAEAFAILRFIPRRGSRIVEKVLRSAVANATHNYDLDETRLYVSSTYVDHGPTMKRWMARARGMASPILKHTSHVTVVVREREEV